MLKFQMEESENSDFPPKLVEITVTVTKTSDFPPKKLARQLDFSEFCLSSTITPKHSQLPPKPKSCPAPRAPLSVAKLEARRPQPQNNIEVKDGTLKDHKQCRCKQSKCLKLYCACFASGTYCDGCDCDNCYNNVENEAARRAAVGITLERNPNAFRRITGSSHGTQGNRDEAKEIPVVGEHKGCRCKKSGCLKRYCECFQANILCHEDCKCVDCKNFEECEESWDFHLRQHQKTKTSIQPANTAITAAMGFTDYCSSQASGKSKCQERFLSLNEKDPPIHRLAQYQQVNHFKASGPHSDLSVVSIGHIVKSPVLGSSEFAYRSLLADTIQPRDIRQLCSLLVVVSEATKMLADKNRTVLMQATRENQMASLFSVQDSENCKGGLDVEKAVSDDHLSENLPDIIGADDSRCGGADAQIERPMSPRTFALMCDEKDTLFMATASPNQVLNHNCNADVYAAQERLVLASFLDCLNRLIYHGNLKETKCFSSANAKAEGQHESVGNSIVNVNTEMMSGQETVCNGTGKAHGPGNTEIVSNP